MFIVFEGIDGSGKTTQSTRLVDRLEAEGVDLVQCKDPGSTPIGIGIRKVLQDEELAPSEDADLLLFTAARVELWTKIIRPAIDKHKLVICDRFVDSTFAYQIRGRERIQHSMLMFELHERFINYYPALTILIDVPVNVAKRRIELRNAEKTRFENFDADFFQRVREGYLEQAEKAPHQYLIVDGETPEDEIAERIYKELVERGYV